MAVKKNEMVKTSGKYCENCKYSIIKSRNEKLANTVCEYYLLTGNRRGCPIGWCDKFEPRDSENPTKRVRLTVPKGE